MNDKILKTLEFDKVKVLFAPFLVTHQGKEALDNLTVLTDADKIQILFDELSDFIAVKQENGDLYLSATGDVRESLKRLELKAALSRNEFAALKKLLSALFLLQSYFEEAVNASFPHLEQLLAKLSDFSSVHKLLSVFDDDGTLYDTASDRLFGLRKSIKREQSEVRSLMQDLLSKHSSDLTEQLITVREDRQVLPVKVEAKNKLRGIVRDISSSGQTLYIEPRAAVALNESLAQKQIEEKNEIVRLLQEISEKLRPYSQDLRQNAWVLGQIDLIRAKAQYIAKESASIPEINESKTIRLLKARHPLIDTKTAVKNDISFDEKLQTIVITGPNTGGKTITLKTVGLLTLMTQAGLPIPAAAGSEVAIFQAVYADIGDEQSIEANLSTFSSHLTHIVGILKAANEQTQTLALLDELGAGTDPKEGAALAIAILEYLRKKAVKTLATTHYPELKAYGVETEGVSNASVAFDLEKMRPTYQLNLGVPGRSNAFEISERLGLFPAIIKEASSLLTEDEHDVNHLIARLEQQSHELTATLSHAQALETENDKLQQSLSKEKAQFDREKAQLLEQARKEATEIAESARAEARAILKNLNERSVLKPHEVIEAMAELDKLAPLPDLSKNRVLKKAKSDRGLTAGAEVMVSGYGQRGKLVRLEKDGRWTVAMGTITAKLDEADFELTAEQKPVEKSKAVKRSVSSAIKAQLDLRGTRYEEAALELDSYIDQALLANLTQITIIHGVGTGVIRELVQQKLTHNRHIKSFNYAPINAGGSGATIAVLR